MNYKEIKKQFIAEFQKLCFSQNPYQVWNDLMFSIACSIANAVDKGEKYEEREIQYNQCIERLGGVEVSAKLLNCIVSALERDPNQDFLGSIYMELGLTNKSRGQFFTPIELSNVLSQLTIEENIANIQSKGWTTISDPTCGAGSTLISTANTLKSKGINYQEDVLFVAQDVDKITALMCYIQLSLLGCAGYVVVASTIKDPVIGRNPLFVNKTENQDVWILPMFFSDVWDERRRKELLLCMMH